MESQHADEASIVDVVLLQIADDEHAEMDQLKQQINCEILRLILVPLDAITATNLIELQVALNRYNELKRKYY